MDSDAPVPLDRRFCPVPRSEADSDEREIRATLGYSNSATWAEIDERLRVVILAAAGAGKTHEMTARAKKVARRGDFAFFIRIEDIFQHFQGAFEVGTPESFSQWLGSLREAWFYLDSVDEARLDNPRTFEKAIQHFARKIKGAQNRAHVCISSRPFAWRAKSDRAIVERELPIPTLRADETADDTELADDSKREDLVSVTHEAAPCDLGLFVMEPLGEQDIRLFAQHRMTPSINNLIDELKRLDLMALAERPFDLEVILDRWGSDQALSSRRELLRENVRTRLQERHNPDRGRRQPLNVDRAVLGARQLAAAVVLTGRAGIQVPGSGHEPAGIDAQAVLPDWDPNDLHTLLERGLFDDVIYGAVRFRHRDLRELLAADWFSELLQRGRSRHQVVSLFFREQYGQRVIAPRLRPILPWLLLEDQGIRRRTLAIDAKIAMEGGDPTWLTPPDRKKVLTDVVRRVVEGEDAYLGDNQELSRIAHTDLTAETLKLIAKHADHDDAIFFLARLVWQGRMSDCVDPLVQVAANPLRGLQTRVAATLAIAKCGTEGQRASLWSELLNKAEVPRELLAELVNATPADQMAVDRLLSTMDKLPPYDPFAMTGLTEAVGTLVERLPLSNEQSVEQPLPTLIKGFAEALSAPPYLEPTLCKISQEFSWVLGPSTRAIEKLVAARHPAAFDESTMMILSTAPKAQQWLDTVPTDYENKLGQLVPAWSDLNDALFWHNVSVTRTRLATEGISLRDALPLQSNRYWAFDESDFPRVLGWVRASQLTDDRLVALSVAFRLYTNADRPRQSLVQLQKTVAADPVVAARLEELRNPKVSMETLELERRQADLQQKLESQRRERQKDRSDWIDELRTDPDRVRNPRRSLGQSRDHRLLLQEIRGGKSQTSRSGASVDWQALHDDFGNDVALAFRDSTKRHWRTYTPVLPSEGADLVRVPYDLVFGLIGLQIEANDVDGFPTHLDVGEVERAIRYAIWEINGFPTWLESMYRAHPGAALEAIWTELTWELDNATDQPSRHLLHDLAHFAPWSHDALSTRLLSWMHRNDLPDDSARRDSMRILAGASTPAIQLAAVAKVRAEYQSSDRRPHWYAVWVANEPETGVQALTKWLGGLGSEDASRSAQLFVVALTGSGRDAGISSATAFHTPTHLKTLFLLMLQYIRPSDDVDRSGGGFFRAGLRDDAQHARQLLLELLSALPGKPTFVALTDLARRQPDPRALPWITKLARERAEYDGDLEPWSDRQVSDFGASLASTPATPRQLFDLLMARMTDLKGWLEAGDNSPYQLWQRAENEDEIRILITNWLDMHSRNHYTTAQEPELANRQRIDIRLQSPEVHTAVPIELKLLDKGWTGPKLCERLQNQLAGDYLRAAADGYGLMVLVSQRDGQRRWRINGRLVGLASLADALMDHWATVANCFPNVASIEVLTIDLTRRAERSTIGVGA